MGRGRHVLRAPRSSRDSGNVFSLTWAGEGSQRRKGAQQKTLGQVGTGSQLPAHDRCLS